MTFNKNKKLGDFIKNRVYRVLVNYADGTNSSGSGFFIGKDKFLTCSHVIFGCGLRDIQKDKIFKTIKKDNENEKLFEFLKIKKVSIFIEISDLEKIEVEIRDFNFYYDVALLKVDIGKSNINKCVLDFKTKLAYGEEVAFGGFSDQFGYEYDKWPFSYNEGIVSSYPEIVIEGGKYKHIKINSINLPGNSGTPLFSKKTGKVVGIVNGNMNWGRDNLLIFKNSQDKAQGFEEVSNRIPLSIAYATSLKILKEKTKIF